MLLQVGTHDHELRYFVAEKAKSKTGAETLECVFAHGREEEGDWKAPQWLQEDLERWKALQLIHKLLSSQ